MIGKNQCAELSMLSNKHILLHEKEYDDLICHIFDKKTATVEFKKVCSYNDTNTFKLFKENIADHFSELDCDMIFIDDCGVYGFARDNMTKSEECVRLTYTTVNCESLKRESYDKQRIARSH